jgi:Spy/CpxP family protein refolding chaperone
MMRFLLTLVMLLWSSLALAQPPDRGRPPGGGMPGGFPWWDSPIATDLNLSDQQQQQIRNYTRGSRIKLREHKLAIDKAEAELADLMNAEAIDQQKANETIERLAMARADMTRAVSQLSLNLRGVLTAQQWQELQKRIPRPGPDLRRDMKMRRRMGDPMPGGPKH